MNQNKYFESMITKLNVLIFLGAGMDHWIVQMRNIVIHVHTELRAHTRIVSKIVYLARTFLHLSFKATGVRKCVIKYM